MRFEVKKTENCFSGAQTYEYRLPVRGQDFIALLCAPAAVWDVKQNHKFRRPLFTADRNGINIKGILEANVIRVSFPECRHEEEKKAFEIWLSSAEGL